MLRGDHRTCDVCDDPIPPRVPFKVAVLSVDAAADLMENIYDPRLIPTWTHLPDGRVELDICLGCAGLMPSTTNLKIRVNS